MKYLVSGTGGAGFQSPEEAKQLLETVVHPSFEAIIALEAEGKVLGAGLPLGDRSVVFILEAASHQEVDSLLQNMSIWSLLEWEVVALQDISGRLAQERELLSKLG